MDEILFLAHRIPYPPDKGDKIRSWHMLRHLAERYTVHLGCFIDDPADRRYRETVRQVCGGDCFFAETTPKRAKLRALPSLLGTKPLSLACFHDRRLMRWVDGLRAGRNPSAAVVFCSAMAPYVMGPSWRGVRRILDMVDVDSDKWRQCAARGRGPMRLIHAREARTLLAFERRAAAEFDATVLVSAREAALFRQLAPEAAPRIGYFANGVDADYFSPDRDYVRPFADDAPRIVFTGAMDYWPNVDAVVWFARDVLPLIRHHRPEAGFVVVGANPTAAVKALAALPNVQVTGRVADVRPYLAHAAVVVAPLRIARGIQNKVLEAMAMGRPVVAAPDAAEGIEVEDPAHLRIAADARAFSRSVLSLLAGDEAAALGRRARDRVLWAYSWQRNLARLDDLLTDDSLATACSRVG